MNVRCVAVCLFFALGLPVIATAQTSVPVSRQFRQVRPDTSYFLDYWVTGSVTVSWHADTLAHKYWKFHPKEGELTFKRSPDIPYPLDTVRVTYRVFPFGVRSIFYRHKLVPPDTAQLHQLRADTSKGSVRVSQSVFTEENLFGNAKIQKSGSFTRGITIGTNQDASLESGLQLNLNGQLTDNLSLIAALTDRNTPIQPEGTTQNLKEFDRVYIRLQSPHAHVQLGDIDVHFNNSSFAKLNRRLQGAEGGGNYKGGSFSVFATAERGTYREQKFLGRDGDQGPYRLTGANGEPFIIILAGTEKVYVDGVLMHRGEQNDYTIDYSLGEIQFTNKEIITSKSRITVDFQYLNQQYSRSVIGGEINDHHLLRGRLEVAAGVIREADSDNPNSQLNLSPSDIQALRKSGNQPAQVSGVDSVGPGIDPNNVKYTRLDTLIDGQRFTYYKNIPGGPHNVYQIRFSSVPNGAGSYRRVGQAQNGIIYEWVGQGQGNYDTLRTITPPTAHTMVTLRSSYRLTKHVILSGEWAGSQFDQNRFSVIGNQNNFDNAYKVGIQTDSITTGIGLIHFDADQWYNGKSFVYFDRAKPVEFDRKWNIVSNRQTQERATETNLTWMPGKQTSIQFGGGWINRLDFNGARQELNISSKEKGLPSLDYHMEHIVSTDSLLHQHGGWFRQQGNLNYGINTGIGTFSPLFDWENESRLQRVIGTDSLASTSLRFYKLGPGMQYSLGGKFQLSYQYSYRRDELPSGKYLKKESDSYIQEIGLDWQPDNAFQTSNQVSFRKRNVTPLFQQQNQETNSRGVYVRSVTNYKPWDKAIDGRFYYEVTTQQKALLQETYVNVGPQLGQYVWKDLNGDGIQQIDEFFPETLPNEGTYALQYVPSDQLFPVISLQTRLSHHIEPARWLSRHGDKNSFWHKVLSNIAIDSRFDIRETSKTQHLSDIYLMRLSKFGNDSTTINEQISWRQKLDIFPDSPDYTVQLSIDQSRRQNRQAIGLDKQFERNIRVYGRYRVKGGITIDNEFLVIRNRRHSENLYSRDFDIQGFEERPGLTVPVSGSDNTTVSGAFIKKQDFFPTIPVRLTGINVAIENRAYWLTKWQLFTRLELRSYNLKGESQSLGLFELTDGAGAGKSLLWQVQANFAINSLLRAELEYDGRTERSGSPVQTLRFTIRAVF